jgi:hypothetical protein
VLDLATSYKLKHGPSPPAWTTSPTSYPDCLTAATTPNTVLPYSQSSPFGFNGRFTYVKAGYSKAWGRISPRLRANEFAPTDLRHVPICLASTATCPDICFSFTGFRPWRGDGQARRRLGHRLRGGGVRVLHRPAAGLLVALAALVADHPLHATTIIAHIRKHHRGDPAGEHPSLLPRAVGPPAFATTARCSIFRRPSKGVSGRPAPPTANCLLLADEGLLRRFGDTTGTAGPLRWLQGAAIALTRFGVINFLLSDGDLLFARCPTACAM